MRQWGNDLLMGALLINFIGNRKYSKGVGGKENDPSWSWGWGLPWLRSAPVFWRIFIEDRGIRQRASRNTRVSDLTRHNHSTIQVRFPTGSWGNRKHSKGVGGRGNNPGWSWGGWGLSWLWSAPVFWQIFIEDRGIQQGAWRNTCVWFAKAQSLSHSGAVSSRLVDAWP